MIYVYVNVYAYVYVYVYVYIYVYVYVYVYVQVSFVAHGVQIKWVQSGADAPDASSCRSFSAKEPPIIGLFCGKWPLKIRHSMPLRHPVARIPIYVYFVRICKMMYVHVCIIYVYVYVCVDIYMIYVYVSFFAHRVRT